MKAAWYCLTHKKTGEQQIVCALEGVDLEQWTFAPLDKMPSEFDDISVCPKGKATRALNKDRRDKARARAARCAVGPDDLLERIEAMERRIARLEERK